VSFFNETTFAKTLEGARVPIWYGVFVSVLGYIFFMIYNSQGINLGTNYILFEWLARDDIFNLYSYNYHLEKGRFTPLNTLNLNVIGLFGGNISFFFIFNGMMYILASTLVAMGLKEVGGFQKLSIPEFLLFLCFLINPFLIAVFFEFVAGETWLYLLFAVFVLSTVNVIRMRSIVWMLIGVLSSVLAIFFKEPAGGAILVTASALFLTVEKKDPRVKLYLMALILLPAFFYLFYFFSVLPHAREIYSPTGSVTKEKLNILVEMVQRWPLIIFCAVLSIYRVVLYFTGKSGIEPSDGLLLGGLAYAFSFPALGISRDHP
jgi:hypothetical protein